MNIIKRLVERLIEARGTNKGFPCNTYGSEAAAEKATAEMAQAVANYFTPEHHRDGDAKSARYVVIQMIEWNGRWVGCIDLTEVVQRPTSTGGYLGIAKGFISY